MCSVNNNTSDLNEIWNVILVTYEYMFNLFCLFIIIICVKIMKLFLFKTFLFNYIHKNSPHCISPQPFSYIYTYIVKLKSRETWHAILSLHIHENMSLYTHTLTPSPLIVHLNVSKNILLHTHNLIFVDAVVQRHIGRKRIKTISWHFVVLRPSIVLNVVLVSVHIIHK